MFEILERKMLSDGIYFSRITDGRFKTNRISVTFFTEMNDAERADYAIVPYILTDGCRKYPSVTKLNEKYSDLYGASLSDNLGCLFDRRSMSFSISSIDDRYTLDGEKLEEECCRLLLDCILDPVTVDGGFDPACVEVMKQELIDAIESIKGDTRSYAAQQGAALAFAGEACGMPVNGTVEQARRITAKSAYNAWRSMLTHARIEIFCAGCSDFTVSEGVFAQALSALQRSDICEPAPKLSPLKAELAERCEKYEMQQAVLRMYFKAPTLDDRYAGALLSLILGGMTTSRFFTNIREKQSLCYYCSCYSNRFKRTITVYAGVDPANVLRTRRAVMSEFMSVAMRGVSDEELEHAKLDLIENARAVYDSAGGLSAWYSSQIADEKMLTPEEFIEGVKQVTAKRVQEVCRLYSLDTVYVLSPEEVKF